MGRVVGLGKGCATLGASERHSTLGEGGVLSFCLPNQPQTLWKIILSVYRSLLSFSLPPVPLSPSTLSL